MATTTPQERGFRKTREGIVISDKMDKTITVEVSNRVKHGMYSKVLSRSTKLKAHDETNSAGAGDREPSLTERVATPLSSRGRIRKRAPRLPTKSCSLKEASSDTGTIA